MPLLIEERGRKEREIKYSILREWELSEDEKKTYIFFQSLISCFKGDLKCVIIENLGSTVAGLYKNNTVYIAREVLGRSLGIQLDTLAHECAHHLEGIFFQGRGCYGTHHNDGPFSLCYRLASWLLLNELLKGEVTAMNEEEISEIMDEEEEKRYPRLKKKRLRGEDASINMKEEGEHIWDQLKRMRLGGESLNTGGMTLFA